MLNKSVLKAGCPLRGLVLTAKLPGATANVSTPLLLIPFGIVPSKELSVLLKSVTGRPLVKRVIPEIDQPCVQRLSTWNRA